MNDFDFEMDLDSILAEFTSDVSESFDSPTPSVSGRQIRQKDAVNEWERDSENGKKKADVREEVPENAFRYDSGPEPSYDTGRNNRNIRKNEPASGDRRTAQAESSRNRRSAGKAKDTGVQDRPENRQRVRAPEGTAGSQKVRRRPSGGAARPSSGSGQRKKREETVGELYGKGRRTAEKAVSGVKRFVLAFTGLVFGAGALLVLAWMLVNVHPDSSMASSQLSAKNRANIVARLDSYANNAKGELLSGLTFIRKHYLIPEGDLVAPEAPAYNYGATNDPGEVLAVIEEAREYGLLDGQEVIFNENVDFYYDSDIEYYCDETLLVICWKELIDNRICSCVEVKAADGSQLRRKLAEDTYGSSTYVYATELASQCNAVVAMNADYYAFRDLGVTVYNRKLYRFDDANYNGQFSKYNATDSLLIDSSGDFHIFHKGETSTRENMEQYVTEQNIMFSVAFGPVLVEEGEQVWCDWYPVGEVDKEYSRAGIAQVDQLHYLYMTVSFADNENEYHPRCTVNEFAALMAGKGVKTAYCLDGGQTGEVVFRGTPYNHIDFGTERTVSDIIYFATAVPESER